MLGIGDHIDRAESKLVFGLAGIGVTQIGCGSYHGFALTLDGRLFLWGSNMELQLCDEKQVSDCSAPIEFKNSQYVKGQKICNQVLEACCGSHSTVILMNDLNFKVLKKPSSDVGEVSSADDSFESNLRYDFEPSLRHLPGSEGDPYMLSHGRMLVVNHKNVSQFLLKYLTEEQLQVQHLIQGYYKLIKVINKNYEDVSKLVECYEKILYVHINNLNEVIVLLRSHNERELKNVFLNTHFEYVLQEFYKYLKQLCDIKSSQSYEKFSRHFAEATVRNILEKVFSSLISCQNLFDLIYDLKLYENSSADVLVRMLILINLSEFILLIFFSSMVKLKV